MHRGRRASGAILRSCSCVLVTSPTPSRPGEAFATSGAGFDGSPGLSGLVGRDLLTGERRTRSSAQSRTVAPLRARALGRLRTCHLTPPRTVCRPIDSLDTFVGAVLNELASSALELLQAEQQGEGGAAPFEAARLLLSPHVDNRPRELVAMRAANYAAAV